MSQQAVEDRQAALLPFYLVIDESSSMSPWVRHLNEGLESLLDAMHEQPSKAAKVRLTVLGFSADVRCHLDLQDLRDIGQMPVLDVRDGGTSYSAAFSELLGRIDADVDRLALTNLVHRPTVFFLTDGQPAEVEDRVPSWRESLSRLQDPEYRRHPNILAFGVQDAKPQTIAEIASRPDFAYQQSEAADVGKAISNFMQFFVQSIVASATTAEGADSVRVPSAAPDGFVTIDLVQ